MSIGIGRWVAVGCAAFLMACSGSEPDTGSTADGQPGSHTYAASSTTRQELGVDNWEMAREDDGSAVRSVVTTGYSPDGEALEQISVRRTAGTEGWIEFSVLGPTPAVARFAVHSDGTVSQEGANHVLDDAKARETAIRVFSDVAAAEVSSSISTNRLRTTYVGGSPDLVLPETPASLLCFNQCMGSVTDLYGNGAGAFCREIVKMGAC